MTRKPKTRAPTEFEGPTLSPKFGVNIQGWENDSHPLDANQVVKSCRTLWLRHQRPDS